MNTVGKLMDSVLARRITFLAEQYGLLPRTHTGGRKGSSTEHAVHLLMEKIWAAWRTPDEPVATLLMLDVSGAYDNVSHERLLHNMRKRRLPPELVGWIQSYLTGRTTRLRLQEGESDEFIINTGIPQGSPLSPILYLFYNADLLEIQAEDALVTGYVDDTSILVSGPSTEANTAALLRIHELVQHWARQHASVFSIPKYELMHFARRGHRAEELSEEESTRPLVLPTPNGGTHTLKPSKKARYLGVILDPALSGTEHLKHVEERSNTQLGVLASLGRSTWGLRPKEMRQLYISTVIPKMLYAASTWYIPEGGNGYKLRKDTAIRQLSRIQQRALCLIGGAFRTTTKAALEAELYVEPIEQRLNRTVMATAMRIYGSPLREKL